MASLNLKDSFDIFINSDDCQGSNTNFNVSLVNNTSLIGKPAYVMLKDAQISLGAIYQIQSTDVFAFSVDGTSTISFTFSGLEGTYTVTSLTNLLKSQMESLDGVTNTYTFGYNSDTNKINFSAVFSSGVAEIRGGLCSENIQKILGCGNDNLTLTVSGTTLIFPLQCDFYPNFNFYLCSSLVNARNCSTNQKIPRNTLLKLHQHNRFTRTYYRINDSDIYTFYVSSMPLNFYISIVDEDGMNVSIPSNMPTQLTLRIFPA